MQHGYLELKIAHELFQKAPDALSETERLRLTDIAGKQAHMEQCILASTEASHVIVPPVTVTTRLNEISQRYAKPAEMEADLERLGLTADTLAAAIERDLRIEAVLDKVAAAIPPVNEVDAEIYYRLHPKAFDRPEARRLRHILLTFETPIEKTAAWATLDMLRSTVKTVENFAQAALRHSQCPTAMEGGQLGTVKRQQLFPELEDAAFALTTHELSAVLESPMGLHLLRCDEILADGLMPFSTVCSSIIDKLTDNRRRDAQRHWIKQNVSKLV